MKRMLRIVVLVWMCLGPMIACAREPAISFSLESGFYETRQILKINCDQWKAKIYYTLDGTIPDDNSLEYTNGILLKKSNEREDVLTKIAETTDGEQYVPEMDFPTGHVIRAVAISIWGEKSEVISATYLIGYNRKELYGNTPMIFLVTDPSNLFDYEKGIYVLGSVYDAYLEEKENGNEEAKFAANFTQRGMEWERPVTVTYLPEAGEGFTQEMGMRIKGGLSRRRTQKSIRLIAREIYSQKNLQYVLFEENIREADGRIVDKYKSFTLRNGGNDINHARIRDPLFTNLSNGLRFETAQNKPCIAFINGEYWGIYTLTEEFTDNYIQYHYGIDNDNVVIFKNGEMEEGEEDDADLDHAMIDYIRLEDMGIKENYIKADELLDLGSFADYSALHIYIANLDGPFQNWNWQMWRVREQDPYGHPYADGKWRMMLFDTEYSSGIYSGSDEAAIDNITPILTSDDYTRRHPARLLISLLKSEAFKREFILSICDVRNLYFRKTRVNTMMDKMLQEYMPYIPDSFRRFGPQDRAADAENIYESRVYSLNAFLSRRYDSMLPIVQDVFELSKPCGIKVETSGSGKVYLNHRTIPVDSGEEYLYFSEYGLTATAVPDKGAKFTGWKVSDESAKLSNPASKTTEIAFDREFTLTACFE